MPREKWKKAGEKSVVSGQLVRQASRGRESAGAAFSVARAFQPEICPLRLVRLEIAAQGLVLCRQLVSREAAKTRRKTQSAVARELTADR